MFVVSYILKIIIHLVETVLSQKPVYSLPMFLLQLMVIESAILPVCANEGSIH